MSVVIVSSQIASDLVILVTVVATILFLAISEVTDVHGKRFFVLLNRFCIIFTMPLLLLFAYTAVILGAKILAG